MTSASMDQLHSAAEARWNDYPARWPLLVASDGSGSADAAICAAHAIAARTGQSVVMIAVHALIPVAVTEVGIVTLPGAEAEARLALHDRVASQVARLRVGGNWPLEIVTGDPAESIAQAARTSGAELIVMGIGGYGIAHRFFGHELVLAVLRLAKVPVLAAAPHFLGLPKRVIAAMDFSAASVRAVRAASQVMQPGGTMSMVHVIPRDHHALAEKAASFDDRDALDRAFDHVVAEIGTGNQITFERSVPAGNPAKELLRLAGASGAELIAAGSHGYSAIARLLLGSVSTRLVRGARCSVLVAPPEEDACGGMTPG